MGNLDRTTVTLIPDQLVMSQELDMPIFRVIDWSLDNKTLRTGKQGISMVVVMKRKIISEMMTTYFPSILLTAITFATTFFRPFFFEAALSVNLTTMLVMTTIFISKMEGLPPTSNTKMIDCWLILCQLVPFAQVVLLTAMEYLREEEKEEDKEEAKDVIEVEAEEACNIPQKKTSKMAHVPMLMAIGKICPFKIRYNHQVFPQRRKSYRWQFCLLSSSTLGLLQASTVNSFSLMY